MSSIPSGFVTPEQYLELERAATTKSEYFNGQVIAMSGASLAHNYIATNLLAVLLPLLKGSGCRPLVADMRVYAEALNSYVYPDITIVCGEPLLQDKLKDTLLNPTILIEILSPSTQHIDRGRKMEAYKEIPSLQEYILVDQAEPVIHRNRKQGDGWSTRVFVGIGGVAELLPDNFAISMKDIYEGVKFDPPAVFEHRAEYGTVIG
jgi:Uma2 family endonuclease